ncbi:hypothetical protein L873DRAFT_1687777 [Choiromyces venosus 120613-1]|uniref:alpha,alpha-trehalase n=1 Tax=Choiromyces venosus 120613-1 TaxID=1336337 RepID=A0A3N4JNN5_9PEZI|nr:hypothetical protein L873DRAFT_1687777 [Choiromyces venosus 120613-1]
MAVLLFALAFLGLSSALPRIGDGLTGSLVERQFTSPSPPDFDNNEQPHNITDYDPESWTLSTKTLITNHYQTQPYVANGYHGSRIPAEGIGYLVLKNNSNRNGVWPINGWPLDNPRQTVATISGFWDSQHNTTRTNFPELLKNGGESVISGIPTWSTLYVTTPDGKYTYAPGVPHEQIESFNQSLSIRNGILTTRVKWTPVKGGISYDLKFTILAHRSRINLGLLKLDITPSEDGNVIVTDILDGAGAQRTEFSEKAFESKDNMIWTAVSPVGVPDVAAYEFSTLDFPFGSRQGLVIEESRKNANYRPYVSTNHSTISQEWQVETTKDQTVTIIKYVGIASTDAFPNPKRTAHQAALDARACGWDTLVKEHNGAWDELWDDGDIVVHGDEQMQIAVRASLFHLLANIRGGSEGKGLGDNSIAVGGLASDSYAGFVFWDADLWMLPGLLALHPDHASAINNYRSRMLPQARENAKQYNSDGVLYPWTSARFGNCTATGPCVDYQYHLNTDIALVNWHQFLTTGDEDWLKRQAWPIIKGVADMWASKVRTANETGDDGLRPGMYVVRNMTDPDEYANHVDNGAFTNAGIKVIMGIAQAAAKLVGETAPSKWKDVQEKIFIPFNTNANIIPEYGTMNGSVKIKQADVVLINYPLEFRLNESQALNDLDFYARAQSPDGPAMTWAMFAINAADLSPAGCASYTYLLYASQPYLREPYYQFSEQINDNIYENGNTNPAFTFLTGHGGFLQVPTHGFTGYRPRLDAFYLDPSLPPQLEGVEVKGMKHQGSVFNILVNSTNTTITRIHPKAHRRSNDSPGPVTIRIGSRNKMAGDWKLSVGQSLVIPTRRPDLNGTDLPGNKAQCKRAEADTPWYPGQFPLAAVDGSNHTVWQSATSKPSALTVDLEAPTQINGVSFNWASQPPESWTLLVGGNETTPETWRQVYHSDKVEISDPWIEDDALIVRIRTGNTTTQMFDQSISTVSRWVRLVVEGNKGREKERGPTVAQFGIL